MPLSTPVYHHGNLRQSLLANSLQLLREGGTEALSLRKLAELSGVSRAAPYHHFADKQALLAAVAEQGFAELSGLLHGVVDNEHVSVDERLHQAVLGYLDFALQQPALYELMFGQALWQADSATEQTPSTAQFRRVAKDCSVNTCTCSSACKGKTPAHKFRCAARNYSGPPCMAWCS